MGSDVEKIFEKGEEGMQNAEGFIKQMVSPSRKRSLVSSSGRCSPEQAPENRLREKKVFDIS